MVTAKAQVPTLLAPKRNRALERMLASLEPLPLTGDQRMRLIQAVGAFAGGASDAEVNQRMMLKSRGYDENGDVRLLYRAQMIWALRSGRFPLLQKTVEEGLSPVNAQEEFEFGLDAMLDGLAARFGI